MSMIEVEIIAPDKPKKHADIDSSASLDRIKADIVRALQLGNPDDFDILVSPKSKKEPFQNYVPSSGDTLIITKPGSIGSTSVYMKDS